MTSVRTRRMVASAPIYYQTSRIYKDIQNAIALELDGIDASNEDLSNQLYVRTATWGLVFWERQLGLIPVPTDTYDVRRSRVLGRLRGIGSFSAQLVHSIASAYTRDEVKVLMDFINGWVTVEFIEDFPNTTDFKDQLEEIVHAHLGLQYRSRMKATTQLKATQKVETTAVKLNFFTVPWGFIDNKREFFFNGVYKFDGERVFSGDNRRIGPKHVFTREQIKTAFIHNVKGLGGHPLVDQNVTQRIRTSFAEKAFPIGLTEALTLSMVAYPSRNYNFNGVLNFDGKQTFGKLFVDQTIQSFKLRQELTQPVQATHNVKEVITVRFPTTLKTTLRESTQLVSEAYTGAATFDGRLFFDGRSDFNRILVTQKATLKVVKNDQTIEEVAV